jgi:MFS family permease
LNHLLSNKFIAISIHNSILQSRICAFHISFEWLLQTSGTIHNYTNSMPQPNTSAEFAISMSPNQHSEDLELDIGTTFSDQASTLPPIDGGFAAWRLLLAAFVFEALLWGFPLSFGVFQDHYSRLPAFKDSPYISVVGTSASGISYLGAPVVIPLIRRWSRYRTQMILVGWPLCIAGLIAGSFADRLSTLILTQGVMYGIGFIIFYYPILSMVDEFWVRRRGMAYGFLCSASGVSGAVTPLVLQALLRRFGHRTTLRAVAVMLVVLTGPLIPLLKGRVGQQHNVSLRTDWSFLKKRLFWTYSLSNLLMGIGYFFPSLYLPSYASSIGLGSTKGALLLALMSVSQVAGQFTFRQEVVIERAHHSVFIGCSYSNIEHLGYRALVVATHLLCTFVWFLWCRLYGYVG